MPLLLLVGNVTLQLILGVRYTGQRQALRCLFPMLLVVAWALVASIMLPQLFTGQVYVWPQKYDSPFVASIPLAPGLGNITQDIYLVANSALLFASALFCGRSEAEGRNLIRVFMLSGFLVAVISYWQFVSTIGNIPFPVEFFHSNPGWAQLNEQVSGGTNRINGSFEEPSALASFMFAVVSAMAWMVVKGHPGWAIRILLVLGVITILISTSTTGYAALAMLAVAMLLYAVISGSPLLLRRVIMGGLVLLFVFALGAATAITFSLRVQAVAQAVLAETLDKRESHSYDNRTTEDLDSLETVFPTYGLGVGWGSNRSSSLIPGLIAGLGVYGGLLLVWFVARVIALVRQAGSIVYLQSDRWIMDCTIGFTVGLIVANIISGPQIVAAEFYLMLGLLIGTCSRVVMQRGSRGHRGRDRDTTYFQPKASLVHAPDLH